MDPLLLLPIAAFAGVAIASLLVIRRAGRALARTREAETFRRSTHDLAARVETSLRGACERVDALRRRQIEPAAVEPTLTAAGDAVGRYVSEARALRAPTDPPDFEAFQVAIVAELERAARAIELVEHGCAVLVGVRRGPRELEAQTSIKRGYLNLLHAREAIGRHASAVEATRTAMDRGRRGAVRDHTM